MPTSSNCPFEREPRYERIDLSLPEITERLAIAPLYVKRAMVHIRRAIPGEVIVTRLASGLEETANTAKENQVVVTNPSGEEQIVDNEKAALRYQQTDIPGVYEAKGIVRAVDNPLGRPIEIIAPWGEIQYGDADCMIVALFDPQAPMDVDPDRYIIAANEFNQTYRRKFSTTQFEQPLGNKALHLLQPVIEQVTP